MTAALGRRRPSAPEQVTIVVDGTPCVAVAGQSVAGALIAAGRWTFGRDPVTGRPLGPFCGSGACFGCEVTVDGQVIVRACLIEVTAGGTIDTGRSRHDRRD